MLALILIQPQTSRLGAHYGQLETESVEQNNLFLSFSQKYERNITTYEKCISAYRKTLDGGKFRLGESVWIDGPGVHMICALLHPDMSVLEFGTGGSTSLFSQFVRSWDCVEHNQWWADKVSTVTANTGDKVGRSTEPMVD